MRLPIFDVFLVLIQHPALPEVTPLIQQLNDNGWNVAARDIVIGSSGFSQFELTTGDGDAVGVVRSFARDADDGQLALFLDSLLVRISRLPPSRDVTLVKELVAATNFAIHLQRDMSFDESEFGNIQFGMNCHCCRYSPNQSSDGACYINENGMTAIVDEAEEYLSFEDVG